MKGFPHWRGHTWSWNSSAPPNSSIWSTRNTETALSLNPTWIKNITDSFWYNLGDAVASPWVFVSLRVRWAEGLWVTEVNFDPEVLKVRGMVLASEGNRKCKEKSGKLFFFDVCVWVWVCWRDTHLWRSVWRWYSLSPEGSKDTHMISYSKLHRLMAVSGKINLDICSEKCHHSGQLFFPVSEAAVELN